MFTVHIFCDKCSNEITGAFYRAVRLSDPGLTWSRLSIERIEIPDFKKLAGTRLTSDELHCDSKQCLAAALAGKLEPL